MEGKIYMKTMKSMRYKRICDQYVELDQAPKP